MAIEGKECRAAEMLEALRQTPLLAGMPEEAQQELARYTRLMEYAPDTYLLQQGERSQVLLILVSGRVRVQVEVVGEGEGVVTVPLAHRGPGEYLGELSLIDGGPHMADVVVVETCRALRISRAGFQLCCRKSPEFCLMLLKEMARRLRQFGRDHIRSRTGEAVQLLAVQLLQEMRAHSTPEPEGGVRLRSGLTHEQLATSIGTARETVSRELGRLKRAGILSADGRQLIIKDVVRLQACVHNTQVLLQIDV